MGDVRVEICIGAGEPQSTQTAVRAAYLGGADRIELCAAMDLQGLTPAKNCIKEARAAFVDRPGLVVMIRPRGGDFFYTRGELAQMHASIEMAAQYGADGVAFASLDKKT